MNSRYLLFILLFPILVLGQDYENILITDESGSNTGPCEPSIAIDPTNPDRVVAASVLNGYHYSTDGGRSWTTGILESSYGVWGDPVVLADWKGNFYYFHLSDPSGLNWRSDDILDRIVCQRSLDGGKTWSDGSFMGLNPPKDQDKEWATADRSSGNLYCTWTQFDRYGSKSFSEHKSNVMFSKSTDQGLSWSEAARINQYSGNCMDGDSTTEGASPCVGPKGEVYVAWSFDEKIYFDRSLDKGETWMEDDKVIAVQPEGWNVNIKGLGRANGMPFIACDLSKSEYRGSLYVNWIDHRNGSDDPDVFISYSRDKGLTWSDPIRVNDDDAGHEQFFTNMEVDPVTGYIYVLFYDRRDHNRYGTDVYLALSRDGGVSFENIRISESSFELKGRVFFGDYSDIAAYNGQVRPIWTRLDDGKLSVWTALIEIDKKKK